MIQPSDIPEPIGPFCLAIRDKQGLVNRFMVALVFFAEKPGKIQAALLISECRKLAPAAPFFYRGRRPRC